MDNVKGEASYSQRNIFADAADSVDYIYDTEETDDDDNKYEFTPRVVVSPPVSKRSHGGRNSLTDWTEHETFVLLEAWGERLLRHNRKSVRLEEWYEVAEKVSEVSKFKRTQTQCRNRLDTLKRKYKKEKAMLAEDIGYSSNWLFFSKMDMIVCSSLNQANGRAHSDRASSSDEMKQMVNSEVHPNHANSLDEKKQIVNSEANTNRANSSDETKDSLEGESEFAKEGNDYLDDIPPKKTRRGKKRGGGDPFKLLADCINKFSDKYEKIESSKRKQLAELEKMRMDFQRDVELEKRKILKRGQIEIAKIWGVDIEENDPSPSNISG